MYDMWQIKDQWLGFNKSENHFFFCLIKKPERGALQRDAEVKLQSFTISMRYTGAC
jgi:hypothetical protein